MFLSPLLNGTHCVYNGEFSVCHVLLLILPVHATTPQCILRIKKYWNTRKVFRKQGSTCRNFNKHRSPPGLPLLLGCPSFPGLIELPWSSRGGIRFSLHSTKDRVASGARGAEQEGGWRRRWWGRPARSGFSLLPAFFRALHLLKAAPSALTNAGDTMAEQQTKAFSPLLTSPMHPPQLPAQCEPWALTWYYTSSDLGRFVLKVERDARAIFICRLVHFLSSVHQNASSPPRRTGAVYWRSPQLSFNGIDSALNTLSYQSKLFTRYTKCKDKLEPGAVQRDFCLLEELRGLILLFRDASLIVESLYNWIDFILLMEELLSGFLTSVILAVCWCTWAQLRIHQYHLLVDLYWYL